MFSVFIGFTIPSSQDNFYLVFVSLQHIGVIVFLNRRTLVEAMSSKAVSTEAVASKTMSTSEAVTVKAVAAKAMSAETMSSSETEASDVATLAWRSFHIRGFERSSGTFFRIHCGRGWRLLSKGGLRKKNENYGRKTCTIAQLKSSIN